MGKYFRALIVLAFMLNLTACSIQSEQGEEIAVRPGKPTGKTLMESRPNTVEIVMSNLDLGVPENPNDDPNILYVEEQTDLDLDITFLKHQTYQDQLDMKIASGEIPAVIQSWAVDTQLLQNGMLLPLNDLLDRYGQNLKKFIPKESWDAVTVNGKIYGIPQTAYGNAPSGRVIYVRKDWMERVGIENIPATPEEFKTMLKAFRDGDPNGNGIADEIPFSARSNLTWIDNVFGMFGANEHSSLMIDGKMVPGYVTPNFKKGLLYISELYNEHLIDPDFLVHERNAWEFNILSNHVGSWIHGTEFAWEWQKKLNKAIPEQNPDVIAIPTPRDPDWAGEIGMVWTPAVRVFNITKSAKNPADVIKLFDWLASTQGQAFAELGVPGETYSKENGEYQYNKKFDVRQGTARWREMIFEIVSYNEELLKAQLENEEAVKKLETAFSIGRKEGIPNPLMTIPTFETFKKYPDHRKDGSLWRDAAAKIILGAKPVDYYDDFIKEWAATGGDEMLDELTKWNMSREQGNLQFNQINEQYDYKRLQP